MPELSSGMEWGCGGTQSEQSERAVPPQELQLSSSSFKPVRPISTRRSLARWAQGLLG